MKNATLAELLRFSVPAALSVLLNNAFKVIDQYSVQWLGMHAQAAVGACTFVLIGMFAAYSVISSGTGPMIARVTGAGEDALARRIVGNALVASVCVGSAVLAGVGLAAPLIARGLGLSGETASMAATYLQWLTMAGFPLVLAPVIDSIFIAAGRSGLVLVLQIVATGLNALLNPLLIYTLDLGIGGAAIATGVSRGVAVIAGLLVLKRMYAPALSDLRPDRTTGRIVRIGLPIGVGVGFYAMVYWGLIRFAVSPLGPAVNAALGIGFSALEGMTWPLFWGISLGVASLVGRFLGAGQPDQALRVIRLATPLLITAGIGAGLVFWFAAEVLCGLFTNDPAVLEQAVLYARILAFSQLFVACECLAEGVLEGAGDTRPVLYWSAPLNLLRVPLGWLVGIELGFGAAGVWWVINLTTAAKAAGKWSSVIRGRWKTIQV